MHLIGRDLSPFVRRSAVSLELLGFDFERRPLATGPDLEAIKQVNPLGRVPALVLDDGAVILDSAAILDWADQEAGPERALIPPSGPERRQVLHSVCLAVGAAEKAVGSAYERNLKAEGKTDPAWVERLEGQAAGGLAALEQALGEAEWFHGRPTQADITAAIVYDFMGVMTPGIVPEGRYPRLAALTERLNETPAFRSTSLDPFRKK
ncbi:Glutathione S-transferase [Tistlia consotensis]|uniref:Glutathione S-transferase n=1 Tax=Tistlia consotensis USBA 355 TaxID=560819 RepID=A0A1Y6BFT2_9PROT|nr:glutathione S-transferase family protein [Tistlia consotensis]SMF07099.1 Glutathione S-transferase [Tistlia consotensis USBA 355]SNR36096.1 Glutathione S-transferase [Tistlia consotensis]